VNLFCKDKFVIYLLKFAKQNKILFCLELSKKCSYFKISEYKYNVIIYGGHCIMKIGALLKYSLYLLIMILVTFLIFTIYLYYFSNSIAAEIGYSFLVPVCMFLSSLLYSMSTHEKGLVRGIEMWIVYFATVCLLKLVLKSTTEISMLIHLIFLPISILGGVIGVNLKK